MGAKHFAKECYCPESISTISELQHSQHQFIYFSCDSQEGLWKKQKKSLMVIRVVLILSGSEAMQGSVK